MNKKIPTLILIILLTITLTGYSHGRDVNKIYKFLQTYHQDILDEQAFIEETYAPKIVDETPSGKYEPNTREAVQEFLNFNEEGQTNDLYYKDMGSLNTPKRFLSEVIEVVEHYSKDIKYSVETKVKVKKGSETTTQKFYIEQLDDNHLLIRRIVGRSVIIAKLGYDEFGTIEFSYYDEYKSYDDYSRREFVNYQKTYEYIDYKVRDHYTRINVGARGYQIIEKDHKTQQSITLSGDFQIKNDDPQFYYLNTHFNLRDTLDNYEFYQDTNEFGVVKYRYRLYHNNDNVCTYLKRNKKEESYFSYSMLYNQEWEYYTYKLGSQTEFIIKLANYRVVDSDSSDGRYVFTKHYTPDTEPPLEEIFNLSVFGLKVPDPFCNPERFNKIETNSQQIVNNYFDSLGFEPYEAESMYKHLYSKIDEDTKLIIN